MSGQRNSGHERRANDLYETPPWVVLDGLVGILPVRGLVIGEPACGGFKMAAALAQAGAAQVLCSDIVWRGTKLAQPYREQYRRFDFTKRGYDRPIDGLITNPPYGLQGVLAEKFIERALEAMRRRPGPKFIAMLLSADFDMAGSRIHLFERCPEYHGCIRLRRRIEWFKRKKKLDPKTKKMKPGSGPSKHHTWFIWKVESRALGAEPVTYYAPSTGLLI